MVQSNNLGLENNTPERLWIEYVLLALVTLVAAALRFYKLGHWSYFVDELYTLRSALLPYSQSLNEPFLILTKKSLETFGLSAFSLRLFPCLFGILTIPLLYFPFKAFFNQRIALLTTFMMAISSWHIYLSQFARWYSLLFLVSTLSLLSFYFFIERNSLKYLVIHISLFFFALSLHLTAGFILVIGVLYLLLLSLIPSLQPRTFSPKRVLIFLSLLAGIALILIPSFVRFLGEWESIKKTAGYWGSTPLRFSLYLLHHLTPSIAYISLAGLLLLFGLKERKGLFLAIYCVFPPLALSLAAALETNVSARYAFFTLAGILLAASFLCIYVIDQLRPSSKLMAWAMIVAILLPSLQTDYLYFTSGYGYRDRLNEAVQFMKSRSSDRDQIFLLPLLGSPKEAQFYFKTVAELTNFKLREEQFIVPSSPDDIDLSTRVWVLGIGYLASLNVTDFDKWIVDHTNLLAEFKANRGPQDNTVRVYLHSPDPCIGEQKPKPVTLTWSPAWIGIPAETLCSNISASGHFCGYNFLIETECTYKNICCRMNRVATGCALGWLNGTSWI